MLVNTRCREELFDHVGECRLADHFVQPDEHSIPIAANAVATGIENIQFSSRFRVPQVVNVSSFQNDVFIISASQRAQVDVLRNDIQNDFLADQFLEFRGGSDHGGLLQNGKA